MSSAAPWLQEYSDTHDSREVNISFHL